MRRRLLIILLICGSCAAEDQETEQQERRLPTFQEMTDAGVETLPEAVEYVRKNSKDTGRLHIGAYAAEYVEMIEYYNMWLRDHRNMSERDRYIEKRTGRGF